MGYLRCPQCHNVIEAPALGDPVCPRCGFTAPVPRVATTGYGSAPPPAPPATPVYSPLGAPTEPAPFYVQPVVAPAVGRPRNFWISLLLGVATLGVYFFVWNYKVFREVDEEHGVRHATAWYWSAFVFVAIAVIVFFAVFVSAAAKTPAGQRVQVGPEIFLVYPFLLISTAIFLAYLFKEISRLERFRQMRGLTEGLAPVWFLLLYIIGMFFFLVPMIVAYALLQKSVNEVWWNVYTQRQIPWPL